MWRPEVQNNKGVGLTFTIQYHFIICTQQKNDRRQDSELPLQYSIHDVGLHNRIGALVHELRHPRHPFLAFRLNGASGPLLRPQCLEEGEPVRRGIDKAASGERLLDDFNVFAIRVSKKDDGALGVLRINLLNLVCMNETLQMKAGLELQSACNGYFRRQTSKIKHLFNDVEESLPHNILKVQLWCQGGHAPQVLAAAIFQDHVRVTPLRNNEWANRQEHAPLQSGV